MAEILALTRVQGAQASEASTVVSFQKNIANVFLVEINIETRWKLSLRNKFHDPKETKFLVLFHNKRQRQ